MTRTTSTSVAATLLADLDAGRKSSAASGFWAFVSWFLAERAARKAAGELARLDDRMLADIGISRSEIDRYVRGL